MKKTTEQTARCMLSPCCKTKKQVNIFICSLIVVLGISSFIVSAVNEADGNLLLNFRYMTVNGTLFTLIISTMIVVLNMIELKRGREFTSPLLYYTRLSSVVTEAIIGIVIAMSFLPFIPDNPNVMCYDSFNMHVTIPLLSIISFLINDHPVENMKPIMRLHCAWPITLYATVVISMIIMGLIPQESIPYSFLEIYTRPLWYILLFAVLVYSCAYFLSWALSEGNRRVSWIWTQKVGLQNKTEANGMPPQKL